MSSAAAKAEARRKAILARGSDRLSKLTSTARGEGDPVYANVDVPSRRAPTTETLLGEETIMPTPPTVFSPSPSPGSRAATAPADNSGSGQQPAWSQEQQSEFIRALMAAPDLTGGSGSTQGPGAPLEPGAEAGDDPMAAMLNALTQMTGGAPFTGAPGMIPGAKMETIQLPKPKSLFVRLRPLLHLILTWLLLAFFVFVQEPMAYLALPGASEEAESGVYGAIGSTSLWDRWSELGKRFPGRVGEMSIGVQPLPFFWAFTTLQLVLHSISIFSNADPIQPPTLLALALPHLPSQIRSLITNVLAYARMGSKFLDDVAALIFGIGFFVWIAGWVSSA